MKKLLTVLLIGIMVFTMASCSGSSDGGGQGGNSVKKVVDDTRMGALNITVPENWKSIERTVYLNADDVVSEKDMNYLLDDDGLITYAYMEGVKIEEYGDLSIFETRDVNGNSWYVYKGSTYYYGFFQYGEDLYGVSCSGNSEISEEQFLKVLEGVEFSDKKADIIKDDKNIYDINYVANEGLNVAGYTTSVTEDRNGEITDKSVMLYFGQDQDNVDFRFIVEIFRNQTLEEVVTAETTGEAEFNGISYVTVASSDDEPHIYYTQHNDDVYMIRNSGASDGWFVTRSDESKEAFKVFLENISFK